MTLLLYREYYREHTFLKGVPSKLYFLIESHKIGTTKHFYECDDPKSRKEMKRNDQNIDFVMYGVDH